MKKLILTSVLFLCTTVVSFSQSFKTEEGKATFYSKVPLHNFEGNSENLVGLIDLEKGTVDFYIDLETLDTGNGKRDKDMKLTLETKKYPFAEFFGTLTSDFDSESGSVQDVTVKGTFKIHGEEQEIEVEGTLQMKDDGLHVTAGWILSLTDYKIEPPKILFIKVDENQEIKINALLKPVDG
ncbi:MAG: YceI family protein [Balneola sp.]